MRKCDRCQIRDDIIKRYCVFVYGKRQCYKKDIVPKLKTVGDCDIIDHGRVIGKIKNGIAHYGEGKI
jgi:hypothetical protein